MFKTIGLILLILLAFPTAYRVVECTLNTDSWAAWKACVGNGYRTQLKGCAVQP